jgi:hypothetical protein
MAQCDGFRFSELQSSRSASGTHSIPLAHINGSSYDVFHGVRRFGMLSCTSDLHNCACFTAMWVVNPWCCGSLR